MNTDSLKITARKDYNPPNAITIEVAVQAVILANSPTETIDGGEITGGGDGDKGVPEEDWNDE